MAAQGVPDVEHPAIPSPADYIMHHVMDGYEWEVPGPHGFADHFHLRDDVFGTWKLFGIDFTPTQHTVMLWVGALVVIGLTMLATRKRGQVPRGGLQTSLEMFVVFIRDEIAIRNIGHDGKRYVPFLCTAFFFILTVNLLGLIPYSATATSNLNVTLVLALCTFVMTQVAGMRGQGVVGYWAHIVPSGVPWWLYPLMIPVEILGLFTKPFALMMRLFANMLAGHIVLFFLIGLIFLLETIYVAPVAVGLGFAIYMLEIFVAFLQAFIFTMLSSLFIGMASHAH